MVESTGGGSSALRSRWGTVGGRLKNKGEKKEKTEMQMKQMKKMQAALFANELLD